MNRNDTTYSPALGALLGSLVLAACSVEVREHHPPGDADVDIRTPVGGLSVRTDIDARETGLPVYPGALPLDDDHEGDRASVKIDTSFFGLEVAAAEFESPDRPADVIEFYQKAMRAYGDVVQCQGDIDFEGTHPTCDERPASRETQLVTGTASRYRMLTVAPRGSGSEFALVYIHTREGR